MPANQSIPKVVKLDADIRDRLERLGEARQRSPHWLMKEAIKRYLDEEEYEEQLKYETLESWKDVERGNVVSNEAVMRWIKSWGTDQELDRPKCGE